MTKLIDETGNRYGKWTVQKLAPRSQWKDRSATWLCVCDCGNDRLVKGTNLRSGQSKSCGKCLPSAPMSKAPVSNEKATPVQIDLNDLVRLEMDARRARDNLKWVKKELKELQAKQIGTKIGDLEPMQAVSKLLSGLKSLEAADLDPDDKLPPVAFQRLKRDTAARIETIKGEIIEAIQAAVGQRVVLGYIRVSEF